MNQYHSEVYTVKPYRILLSAVYILYCLGILFLLIILVLTKFIIGVFIAGCVELVLLNKLKKIYDGYSRSKYMYLEVSKGENDTFKFGITTQEITVYNKKDIKEIFLYSTSNYKSPNTFEVYILHFFNKTEIKFSNMILSSESFYEKFGSCVIIYGKSNSLKVL